MIYGNHQTQDFVAVAEYLHNLEGSKCDSVTALGGLLSKYDSFDLRSK